MKKIFTLAIALIAFSSYAQINNAHQREPGINVYSVSSPSVVVVKSNSAAGSTQGSGVAYKYGVNQEGKPIRTWIATNAHVVPSGTSIIVESGELRRNARLAYADHDLDLAIIVVEGEVLPIAKRLNSHQSEIGSRVFAIGAPYGLDRTISEGLLSGVREIKGVRVLQTSAPISSGNSGGGLFDIEGRVLGITTFKIKGGENLNFAVDVSYLQFINDALLASGLIQAVYERKITREGDEDNLNEKYLDSPALARWVLQQNPRNGLPFYTYIEQEIRKTINAKIPFGSGHPEFDAMIKNFLSTRDRSEIRLVKKADSSLFRLSCPMYSRHDGKFAFELNLKVEPEFLLVNGLPSTFSESEIKFMTGKNLAFTAILNRFTASLSISSDTFPSMLVGTCEKVPDRQF